MNNTYIKQIIKILLTISTLSSCNYIKDLKRTENEKTLEINWEGASEIEIWAPVRLILVNSQTPNLKLTGMEFIVNGYDIIQQEDKLIIEHQNINWLQDNKIADLYIYSNSFNNITANAPCKITTNNDTLFIDQLNIIVNGKGIYTTSDLLIKGNKLSISVFGGINKSKHIIAGNVESANYHIQGGTDIEALDLEALNTSVLHKSYGDCYLNSINNLQVIIYSTGNVYYLGSPSVTFKQQQNTVMTATGEVLPL